LRDHGRGGGVRELDFGARERKSEREKEHSPDRVDFVVLASLDAQFVEFQVDGDGSHSLVDAHFFQHQRVQRRNPEGSDT